MSLKTEQVTAGETAHNTEHGISDFLNDLSDQLEDYTKVQWSTFFMKHENQSDFDLIDRLKNLNGPVVELGGPTDNFESFSYLGVGPNTIKRATGKNPIMSNLYKYEVFYKGDPREHIHENDIDVQIDATQLPFAEESIGAIMVAHMDTVTGDYKKIAQEANRVLESNGVLIWVGITPPEMEAVANSGKLNIVKTAQHRVFRDYYAAVFTKKQS